MAWRIERHYNWDELAGMSRTPNSTPSGSLVSSGSPLSLTPDSSDTLFWMKHPEEELTFESMKRVLTESAESKKAEENERRIQLSDMFRTSAFEDLVLRSSKSDTLQNKLNEIFSKLPAGFVDGTRGPPSTPTPHRQDSATENIRPHNPPAYEILFPELFAY